MNSPSCHTESSTTGDGSPFSHHSSFSNSSLVTRKRALTSAAGARPSSSASERCHAPQPPAPFSSSSMRRCIASRLTGTLNAAGGRRQHGESAGVWAGRLDLALLQPVADDAQAGGDAAEGVGLRILASPKWRPSIS